MNTEKLTQYLDSLPSLGIPSVDCIIKKDHEIIYRHMAGFTDTQKEIPVSNNTQYLMFSMTKVQTMTAFMQLVEQGKISLEDPIGKYLPAYNNLSVALENGETVPASPILVKHLLSMQSGLDYDLNRPGIRRILDEKGSKATTRELVDSFVESPLIFQPGTHFRYSLSHDVAAAIIEVVSGMSYGEYLRKNIWEPLGMTRTHFAKPVNDEPGLAVQHIYDGEADTIRPMEPTCNYQLSECYESGGAGLISCTEDYSLFADAIASGGIGSSGARILKEETVEMFKTNLLGPASRADLANTMGRVVYGYGLGMQILMEPEKVNSPAPAGIFGWDGAAGSCIIMDNVNRLSLVYTMHVRNCGMAYNVIHPALRDLMYS